MLEECLKSPIQLPTSAAAQGYNMTTLITQMSVVILRELQEHEQVVSQSLSFQKNCKGCRWCRIVRDSTRWSRRNEDIFLLFSDKYRA